MKRKASIHGFTLIEILVVISIIGILAGMLVPIMYFAIRRGQTTTVQAGVKDIEIAFKQYLTVNNVWPDAITEGTVYDLKDDGPVQLFSMISGINEFKTSTNASMDKTMAYDPWSNPSDPSTWQAYKVMFDKNYDHKISLPSGETVSCDVIVWSVGENRIDESGSGDDVTSWK